MRDDEKKALWLIRKAREALTTESSVVLDNQLTIDRDSLRRVIMPLIERSLQICSRVIADAPDVTRADIQEVVLAGGLTRTIILREAVTDYFGRKPFL